MKKLILIAALAASPFAAHAATGYLIDQSYGWSMALSRTVWTCTYEAAGERIRIYRDDFCPSSVTF